MELGSAMKNIGKYSYSVIDDSVNINKEIKINYIKIFIYLFLMLEAIAIFLILPEIICELQIHATHHDINYNNIFHPSK